MLPPSRLLLMRRRGKRNRVFRILGGRCSVYHGVGIFHTDPVRSLVVLHDVHYCIVGTLVGPIALPFEHDLQ